MQMYLIAGESIRLIDEEIKKIVKENPYETSDFNSMEIKDIINEASSLSLFQEKRILVVKNSKMFSSEKISEKDSEELLKYLENPNEQCIIIFTYNGKLDSRKKITKFVKDKYKIIDIPKLTFNDLVERIRFGFKKDNFTISNDGINIIINSCLNNYDLIYNEIEKIKIYYSNPCKVEDSDVKNIVSKKLEDNNFKFIESVINKDLKQSFKLLDELSILKVEPIGLVTLLAREFRLMHFIKTMYEDNKNMYDMCRELKLQNWQLEKMLKNSFKFSKDELENNLKILCECDLEMKTIYFDKYTLLKSYLLKMI